MKTFWVTGLAATSRFCIAKNSTTPIANAEAETVVASKCPQAFARLPARRRSAEESNGSAISQTKLVEVVITTSSTNLHHQLMRICGIYKLLR